MKNPLVWVILVPDPDCEMGAKPLVVGSNLPPSSEVVRKLLDDNEFEGSVSVDECEVHGPWVV